MKKVKDWLSDRKIDEKIRKELRLRLIQELSFKSNSKETREIVKNLSIKFLENLDCYFTSVKCDEENNNPGVIDDGNLIVEIREDLHINSSYKIHTINLK